MPLLISDYCEKRDSLQSMVDKSPTTKLLGCLRRRSASAQQPGHRALEAKLKHSPHERFPHCCLGPRSSNRHPWLACSKVHRCAEAWLSLTARLVGAQNH